MKQRIWRGFLLGLCVCVATLANAQKVMNRGFDFAYDIGGDPRSSPLQVFDDGERTYFQFRSSDATPLIHTVVASVRVAQAFERRPPYLIVAGLNEKYVLSNGLGTSTVEYVGDRRSARAVAPPNPHQLGFEAAVASVAQTVGAERAPAAPQGTQRTARTLRREVPFDLGANTLGKAVESELLTVVNEARGAHGVLIVGRADLEVRRPGLARERGNTIRAWLIRHGVPAERIAIVEDSQPREGVNPAVTLNTLVLDLSAPANVTTEPMVSAAQLDPRVLNATTDLLHRDLISQETASAVMVRLRHFVDPNGFANWELRRSDGNVRNALERWRQRAGFAELVWEARICPITRELTFFGEFSKALETVQAQEGLVIELFLGDKVMLVRNQAGKDACKEKP